LRTNDQPISWRFIGVRYFSCFKSIEAGESEPPEKWFYCFMVLAFRLARQELNFVFRVMLSSQNPGIPARVASSSVLNLLTTKTRKRGSPEQLSRSFLAGTLKSH